MAFVLIAATVGINYWRARQVAADASSRDDAELQNSALVFIKPHANTPKVQELVRNTLQAKGITIVAEATITGNVIEHEKLLGQQADTNVSSKPKHISVKDIPVPTDKFKESFGEEWETVLDEGRACNAPEACTLFGCTADELSAAWGTAQQVVKFSGGFQCGLLEFQEKKLYVFNVFVMSMRSTTFMGAGATEIHCFEVEFSPKTLSWKNFRSQIIGSDDPAEGPVGSLRKMIHDDYKALGLKSVPDKDRNGVQASVSPYEGLVEKINWLSRSLEDDAFGRALVKAGLSLEIIQDWSVDPELKFPNGSTGSVFDALEDMDVDDCLAKMVLLNRLNASS